MRPLRIILAEAATGLGGQEQYIARQMLAMREAGHHLEAICQPDAELVPHLRAHGFQVHTLPMDGAANFVKGVLAIRGILRRGRYDVLNTNSRRDTILAGTAGRLAGVPLVVRTRHLAKPPGSLLSYTIVPHRVIAVSDYVRRGLLQRGVRPHQVAIVYPSLPLLAKAERSTLRSELGLAAQDVVVGCVAVMRPEKGHQALIAAMLPLFEAYPQLHLVLVGSGSPTFEKVQAHVAETGLQARIHLLGRRDDVPQLLAGFDLFALATEREASGTAFVEAAAAGLPVVGTDAGGVGEMMEAGRTGILVPLHDPEALRAALERLIQDPALRRQMGDAGERRVRGPEGFGPDAMVRRLETAYGTWLKELGH